MKIQGIVSSAFVSGSLVCRQIIPVLSIVLMQIALYYIFLVVPNEQVMGPVQRIFYLHVGSAMTTYFAIGLLLISSVLYLALKVVEWDYVAEASASVATLFSSIVLSSGMIWGHSAWNTWWRWEPRLVSFLVLWLMLVSYGFLRVFMREEEKLRNVASVLGILVSVNVPIVIFSVKLLSHSEQLHPEVVANQGLTDSRFVVALLLGIAAAVLFGIWMFIVKLGNVLLREELLKYRRT